MREKFFRFLLRKLERHTPGWIKSLQIQILLNTTAAAFDRPGRRVWQLPQEKALAAYAEYTSACMSDAVSSTAPNRSAAPDRNTAANRNAAPDRKRIFRCAYKLGRTILKVTGFTRREDRERLVFYLYSNIGIKVTGHLPGEIIIPMCYFGRIYTAKQCMTMSLMDWGIISGICGR